MVNQRGPFDFDWLDDSSYHAHAGEGPISDGVPELLDNKETLPSKPKQPPRGSVALEDSRETTRLRRPK